MSGGPPIVVVGAGIIGLATAWQLQQSVPSRRVVVVDRAATVAAHQSGRNSGVIHSGAYYVPGSTKAAMCRRGRALLLDFVREHGVAHEECGKVVVAVEESERPALHAIARRAHRNGVRSALVGRAALSRLEPAVRGVEALRVDDAGIVDFPAMACRLAALVAERGGEVRLSTAVVGAVEHDRGVVVRTDGGDIDAAALVACAGLRSDRLLAAVTGAPSPVSIVPFRGEYHRLRPSARGLCRNLVYPVPDPRFPFLGVHLTRHISGEVLAGPNAVLALAREGYTWGNSSLADVRALAADPGLRALARRHWRTGIGEMVRSLSTEAFARALRRMTPDVRAADLEPWPAGVRAQALHPDGRLADDFVIERTRRTMHVLNAPSPAATASLAIGEHLAAGVAAIL